MHAPDNLDQFLRFDAEQAEWQKRLPVCVNCDEPIEDYYYEINGEVICKDCLDRDYRKDVDDYID